MKIGIIGPLCKDEIIINGKTEERPGGVCYYTGNALKSMGAEVFLFASFGEKEPFMDEYDFDAMYHIWSKGTIRFVNEYPDMSFPDKRIQRAVVYQNIITEKDINNHDVEGLDCVILGPLFHENITRGLVKYLSEKTRVVLAAQGLIRYLDSDGAIVWKNPDNVLSILEFVDYLFLDEKEMEFITGQNSVEEGTRILIGRGAKAVIVTSGEKGSHIMLKKDGIILNIDAVHTKNVKDPTGAGDSYMAGFIIGLSKFGNLKDVGHFASEIATRCIETKGALK